MGLDQKFPARFVNGLAQRFARAFLQILRAAFRCACISFGPNKRVGRAAMETETSRRKRTPTPREPRRPLIISEELFRGVLIKERKRVDRLNQSLVLLLVAVNDHVGADSPSTWVPVIEALAAVTRETDVLG